MVLAERFECFRCHVALGIEQCRESFDLDGAGVDYGLIQLCGSCYEKARNLFGDPEYGGEGWLEGAGWPFYNEPVSDALKEFLRIR